MMRIRMPSYFRAFRCVGNACPDTCCRDWEVVLDRETAAFYRTVPGPLGDLLRAAITESDGEACLQLKEGFCPLLTPQGLCRIQLELGEAHLCRSCGLHPRFAEEYGALREWSLSLACPEAVRLLLSSPAPIQFLEEVTEEQVSGYHDLDPQLYFALCSARKTAIAMAQDRLAPWKLRLQRLLFFAEALQKKLDQHRIGQLDAVTHRFAAGRFPGTPAGGKPAGLLLQWLARLEAINGRWTELLDEALDWEVEPVEPAPDDAYEHLLVYYLYRYFLKAVTDRRLLPRVQLAAMAILSIRELERVCLQKTGRLTMEDRIDRIHRFSREVEHSAENLERLYGWFEGEAALSVNQLAAMV